MTYIGTCFPHAPKLNFFMTPDQASCGELWHLLTGANIDNIEMSSNVDALIRLHCSLYTNIFVSTSVKVLTKDFRCFFHRRLERKSVSPQQSRKTMHFLQLVVLPHLYGQYLRCWGSLRISTCGEVAQRRRSFRERCCFF